MKIKEYQKKVEDLWISNDFDAMRIVLGLCGEVGEVAEVIKKYFRGDYKKKKLKKELINELGDVFYYFIKLCDYSGIDLEKLMEENIKKLEKRKLR